MSLRIHLALAFLICSTLVLGILGVIADQRLATRLAEQQEHLTHASIDRLAKVLAEPVWTLNTSQVHDLMQAELAGSPHLSSITVHITNQDTLTVQRESRADAEHTTSSIVPDVPTQLDIAQPKSVPPRAIGSVAVVADRAPAARERALRQRETIIAAIVLDLVLGLVVWVVLGNLLQRRLEPLALRLARAPEEAAHSGHGDELTRITAGADALLARFETVLDAIGDGVITTRADLHIERANRAAEFLLGPLVGRRLDVVMKDLLLPGSQLDAAHLQQAEPRSLRATDGSERRVSVVMSPIAISTPDTASTSVQARSQAPADGHVIVLRDLTQQLASHERLQQAERLEAIGRLAGGIAHDSNNLLTVIIGATELMAQNDEPTARRKQVTTIIGAAMQAADFNRKLLAFARKEPLQRTTLDCGSIVSEAHTLLVHGLDKRISLQIEIPNLPVLIEGDRTSLVSALLNLGLNARDAMHDGGDLRIQLLQTTLTFPEESVYGGSLPPGDYACLLISDTGMGIPHENLTRLFEPFFTTKAVGRGTGLGLAAVLGAVRAHGGTISVSSEGPGHGSTFRVLLPLSTGSLKLPEPSAPISNAWRGAGLVLFVDDDPVVRMVGQKMVESFGFTVLTAGNGRQGLELFEQHRDEIRLVLMDMLMPVMGGEEAFHALRARDPQAQIIFVSGYAGDADVARLMREGAAGWIHKPFQLQQLAEAMRRVLPQVPQ